MKQLPLSRMIWMSRSIRQPSPRRLAGFVQLARADNEKHGLTGLLVVQDRYRIHVLEGDRAAVTDLFQNFEANASGVGLRLISHHPIGAQACPQALMCLDLTGLPTPSGAITLEQIFGRATLPDDASRGRVLNFLEACLSDLSLKRAA